MKYLVAMRLAWSGAFACDRSQGVIEVTLSKRELVTPPLATEPLLLERAGKFTGGLSQSTFVYIDG